MVQFTPEYLEAYPMLRIEDLDRRKVFENGKVEWFHWPGAFLRTFGNLSYRWRSPTVVGASYEMESLYGNPPVALTSCTLRILYSSFGNQRRAQFLCGCGNKVRRLFFRLSDWSCQDCQGLVYRKQLMPAKQWKDERFDELRRILKNGRPRGMSTKRYWQLSDQMTELYRNGTRYPERPDWQWQRFIISDLQLAEAEAKGLT